MTEVEQENMVRMRKPCSAKLGRMKLCEWTQASFIKAQEGALCLSGPLANDDPTNTSTAKANGRW